MSKNLKTITLEEIEDKIHNHQLWLKWDSEDKRADFSWYDFNHIIQKIKINAYSLDNEIILSTRAYNTFSWQNLSDSIFKWSNLEGFIFNWTNLKNANFQDTNLKWSAFKDANLSLTDFRNAINYNFSSFNENQVNDAIFTDTEYEEKVKKRLEKQEKEIEEKDIVIENTNDKQTDLLIDGFNNIREDFALEERRWLMMSFIGFISLFFLALIPLFDIFIYKYIYDIIFWGFLLVWFLIITWSVAIASTVLDEINTSKTSPKTFKTFLKEHWLLYIFTTFIYFSFILFLRWIDSPTESIFWINLKYSLLPIWILLSSFLYFSIFQYSKAKELRIENQNKMALLHGFQAINSNELITNKDIFNQNISDVVFTKAYREKNQKNLPIDKVIDLIKLSK